MPQSKNRSSSTPPPPPRGLLARLSAPEPEPAWTLATVVMTFVGGLLAFIAGSFVTLSWLPDQPYAPIAGWTLGGLITIIFIMQTRTARARRGDPRAADPDPLRLRRAGGAPLIFVLFLSLGLAILIDLIGAGIGGGFVRAPELLGVSLNAGLFPLLLALLFMVVVQPIAEELIFRGVAYPALRAAFGFGLAIAFSAGLHGLFHLIVYPPNYGDLPALNQLWFGLAIPSLDALVIALVRAHQRSTRASIVAHIGFGLFAVLKALALGG